MRSVPFARVARALREQYACDITCVIKPRELSYKNRATDGLYFITRLDGRQPRHADILLKEGEDSYVDSLVVESVLRNLHVRSAEFWRVLDGDS